MGKLLAQEGKKLAEYLRPTQGLEVSEILQNFSLDKIMSEAENIAPTLCNVLRKVGSTERSSGEHMQKDRSLVGHSIYLTFFVSTAHNGVKRVGSRHGNMHACTNSQRTRKRVPNYDVHLSSRMRRFSYPI